MNSLPIGIEDFKRLRERDFCYIDKSDLITEVLNEQVVLYTRPRRFGKTLNMSMLKYFFSIKECSKELFDGLNISKNIEAMKHMNQYPVIFISLKDMEGDSIDSCIEWLKGELPLVMDPYLDVIRSGKIDKAYTEVLERLFNRQASVDELKDSLKLLSFCLEKYYEKKVIILIDEYDVPLQKAYARGYYDEMVELLRRFLSSALKTNTSLEKGILTGCLRISKESIFTGLNNLSVRSMFDNSSSKYFGFTENEIVDLLKDYDMDDRFEEVQEWYDGYQFGNTGIYNPWSTLNYVNDVIRGNVTPISYWANTSGNDLVRDYIMAGNPEMKSDFDRLIRGLSVEKKIKPELTYREMDDINNVYSFLLFTGYLKVKEQTGVNTYLLEIPNMEIKYIYEEIFDSWFDNEISESKNKFAKSLLDGNEVEARKLMNQLLKKSISYYDTKESFYHGLLIGMLSSENYDIESNKESGYGRFDIAMIPSDFDFKGVVIECKQSASEFDLVKDSQKAIEQIQEKGYIEGFKAKGYTDFVGYGISFYKKSCYITKL